MGQKQTLKLNRESLLTILNTQFIGHQYKIVISKDNIIQRIQSYLLKKDAIVFDTIESFLRAYNSNIEIFDFIENENEVQYKYRYVNEISFEFHIANEIIKNVKTIYTKMAISDFCENGPNVLAR